jgi:hypothetical protein
MYRHARFGVAVLGCALLAMRASIADQIATDVNIVTAIDISNSVSMDEMNVELDGMAQAIRDPRVLQAIQAGRQHRIGFAMFAWHHDQFPTIVSWTTIASDEDMVSVSRAIAARKLINTELEGRAQVEWYIGRLTDLSQAIDHASEMLQAAPFASDRTIINVVGDGEDNVAEDAYVARDRFVKTGGTLNGVVLGDDPKVIEYFQHRVMGGPHAFVMATSDAPSLVEAFARKFLGDIIAAAGIAKPPATMLRSSSRGHGAE